MKLDLQAVEEQCRYVLALPSNRIRGFNYVAGTDNNDTAFYGIDDQRITITKRLVDNIEAATPDRAEDALKAVMHHEAAHSCVTTHWPEDPTPSQAAIINWLEDYRVNQWLLSSDPSLRGGFDALYKAVSHGRNEPTVDAAGHPILPTPPAEVMTFLSELSTRSTHGDVNIQYEYLLAATMLSREAKTALREIKPDVVDYVGKIPDPYDMPLTHRMSLEALQAAERVFQKLEKLLNFEKEQELKKQPLKSLQDAVKKELEKRGQSPSGAGKPQPGQGEPGQGGGVPQPGESGSGKPGEGKPGQSGKGEPGQGGGAPQPGKPSESGSSPTNLSDMTLGQLESLSRALEALEGMPNNGGQGEAIKMTPAEMVKALEKSGGYNQAEAKPAAVATDMVGLQEYNDFYRKYHRIISDAERAFANTADVLDTQGRTQLNSSHRGPLINPRNMAKMVLSTPTSVPPLFRRPHAQVLHGEKEWKLDKLYFAVDGSGSMVKRLPFVRFFLGVVYEAARKAKIPAAIVVAYDGRPHVISTGFNDKPEQVIRRILAIEASGGTNVSEGALKQMFSLGGRAKATEGRLILVTDCETSSTDIQLMDKWAKDLVYPTALVGVGDRSYMTTAAKSFKAGPVIGYDTPSLNTAAARFMSEFAFWMREPLAYQAKHPAGTPRLLSEFQNHPVSRGISSGGMDI